MRTCFLLVSRISMPYTAAASWNIRWDFDTGVQFAAYLAQHIGITPTTDMTLEPLYSAWGQWWSQLLTHTLQQVAAKVEQSMPNETSRVQLQAIADQINTHYQPPTLPHLAATSAFQAICREQWPAFHTWWEGTSGEKARVAAQLTTQLQRLKLPELVASCAKAQRVARIQPFRLFVEGVYWPADYDDQRADSLLVLGRHYIEATYLEQLQTRLVGIIRQLI